MKIFLFLDLQDSSVELDCYHIPPSFSPDNSASRCYLCRMPKSLPEELESKPGLMNVTELSHILDLHPETVREWAREGRLPYVRVGYNIKFDRQRIADWIRDRELAIPVKRRQMR